MKNRRVSARGGRRLHHLEWSAHAMLAHYRFQSLRLRLECDPVFRDKFSPYLVLALFSPWMAEPQADWPPQTSQPGFVYFENPAVDAELSSQISKFLASGTEPIVFTQ